MSKFELTKTIEERREKRHGTVRLVMVVALSEDGSEVMNRRFTVTYQHPGEEEWETIHHHPADEDGPGEGERQARAAFDAVVATIAIRARAAAARAKRREERDGEKGEAAE